MNKTAARLALAFALLGLGASAGAAYTHYQLLTEPGYTSVCDVSETISCTQVYSSPYGVVGGISVAVFGTIGFALATLLAIAGLIGGTEVRENAPGYLFAGSTLALSVVIYLAYASFVLLQLVCVFCVGTYLATVGLFLVSGAAATMPVTSLPGRALGDLRRLAASPMAIGLAVVFLAASVSVVAFYPRDTGRDALQAGGGPVDVPADERAAFVEWYEAQPRVPVKIPAEGAAVLVVKFNDYQCPACGQTHMEYKDVFARFQASHPGALRVVVMDFPLEKECNASVSSELHQGACEAAVAVRLARERGRAEALEDHLVANQRDMTPERVRVWAREIGGVTDFDARYQPTLDAVKADIAYGLELQVRSTPTFFINGTKVEGGLPAPFFEQALAYELARR